MAMRFASAWSSRQPVSHASVWIRLVLGTDESDVSYMAISHVRRTCCVANTRPIRITAHHHVGCEQSLTSERLLHLCRTWHLVT